MILLAMKEKDRKWMLAGCGAACLLMILTSTSPVGFMPLLVPLVWHMLFCLADAAHHLRDVAKGDDPS